MPIPHTLREALQQTAAALTLDQHLAPTASRDAQQLLELATSLTRTQMLTHPDRTLQQQQRAHLDGLIAQRLQHTPIQHLRGSQEFYGRNFRVTPATLIPRPETEHLIDAFLALHPDRNAPLRIADVGTGTGIIAITLALEYRRANLLALDISEAALSIARENAASLHATDIHFAHSDLLAAAHDHPLFDAVVSNPPYIPLPERNTLHPQVRDHEPHTALFSSNDGLDHIRQLIPQAAAHLKPNGWLFLETAGRTPALDVLFNDWRNVHYTRDLQGIDRIVAAQR